MAQAPRMVASLRADVTSELSVMIAQTLAKDPADRPQSAGELLRVLDEALRTGAAVQPSSSARSATTRTVVLVASIAIVVFVAIAMLAIWYRNRVADAHVGAVSVIPVSSPTDGPSAYHDARTPPRTS